MDDVDELVEIFMAACRTGNTVSLENSIAEEEFEVNRPFSLFYGDRKLSPLFRAIETGSDKVLQLLLDKGATIVLPGASQLKVPALNTSDDQFYYADFAEKSSAYEPSPLIFALDNLSITASMRESHLKVYNILLDVESQLPVSSGDQKNYKQFCLLVKAIFDNDIDLVETMLKKSTLNKFYKKIDYQRQPGCIAVKLKRQEIVQKFIEKKICLTGMFAVSVELGEAEIMEMCIQGGYDLNSELSEYGGTALRWALVHSHFPLVDILVNKYGMDIEARDEANQTLIYGAHDVEQLTFLLENYAVNIHVRDLGGSTPLFNFRVECDCYEVMLKHGADPSMHNRGEYPTHYRCSENNFENCKLFKHFQKLSVLDPSYVFDRKNYVFPEDTQWPKIKLDQYEKELELIKYIILSRSVKGQPLVTLYDYLYFGPGLAAEYCTNEPLLKMFKASEYNFENTYPHYGFILNYQLRRGNRRRELNNSLGNNMPDKILNHVLKYLSEKVLQRLGKTQA